MLTCDRCGVSQPADDMLYCVNCGTQLDTATRVRPAFVSIPSQPRVPQAVIIKQRLVWPWIVGMSGLAIAGIAITYALMRPIQKEVVQIPAATPAETSTPTRGAANNGSASSQQPTVKFDTPTPKPAMPDQSNAAVANAMRVAREQRERATFECNDGTYSEMQTSQGACSGHGGIRRAIKTTPSSNVNLPPRAPNGQFWPPWATALCMDGQFTDYRGSFNLCGMHRGVWVVRPR